MQLKDITDQHSKFWILHRIIQRLSNDWFEEFHKHENNTELADTIDACIDELMELQNED